VLHGPPADGAPQRADRGHGTHRGRRSSTSTTAR
jgi:hypothetical protein